jgi:peptidoglycan hydrolase-like protein with peptidoglycan-binding domain
MPQSDLDTKLIKDAQAHNFAGPDEDLKGEQKEHLLQAAGALTTEQLRVAPLAPQVQPPSNDKPASHQWTAGETKILQHTLKELGYDLGKTGHGKDGVDGSKGPMTDQALNQFCKQYGLDPATIDLGSTPANKTTEQFLYYVKQELGAKQHEKLHGKLHSTGLIDPDPNKPHTVFGGNLDPERKNTIEIQLDPKTHEYTMITTSEDKTTSRSISEKQTDEIIKQFDTDRDGLLEKVKKYGTIVTSDSGFANPGFPHNAVQPKMDTANAQTNAADGKKNIPFDRAAIDNLLKEHDVKPQNYAAVHVEEHSNARPVGDMSSSRSIA